MKAAVIGCGMRTPLLIYGVAQSLAKLPVHEIALYDIAPERAELMAALGAELTKGLGLKVVSHQGLEAAAESADYVISSIRPGGMEARARDERIAVEHGYAGQETTGPAGLAMALRTVPVAIAQAEVIRRVAPRAWIINFTNPAGLITQAVSKHVDGRVIGICDTPAELFFRISLALEQPIHMIECDYLGLNHLGWVRGVRLSGEDVTDALLADGERLRRLYPADLFPVQYMRATRLIPTEYVFFYIARSAALANQRRAGATRGEELVRMNKQLLESMARDLAGRGAAAALATYRSYLNRRNASYMKLEASAESALAYSDPGWDPFQGETGYHRIAVEVMKALNSSEPTRIVLNVKSAGASPDLGPEDVFEAPCLVDRHGAWPLATGGFPAAVRGLVQSVKEYERLAIQAAINGSFDTACLALAVNPIVGEWARAEALLSDWKKEPQAA